MRTIGLIGGMSWESTALYYRLLNEGAAARLGGLHSAPLLLHSVDFAPIEEMQTAGRWEEAGNVLAASAQSLLSGGAELIALATNTMHKVAPQIEDAIDVPFVHLVDATATAVLAAGLTRVGLLATGFTMEDGFYHQRMRQHGIEVLVPEADDRAEVHRVIYEELCLGLVSTASRQRYLDIANRLAGAGAEGLVLGCTEIELLVQPGDTDLRQFPTTAIHVEAILDAAHK
ncbi:MAG: aspartate/glutamate racemase family protein [Nocardioidaceae bacterium]